MNKLQLYLLLHFSGILLVFFSYGSLIARTIFTDNPARKDGIVGRKAGAITSGIGLLLILVSGFGMLAMLKLGWPLWILIKIGVWVLLGAMLGLINRKPALCRPLWVLTLLLGLIAVFSVVLKPA